MKRERFGVYCSIFVERVVWKCSVYHARVIWQAMRTGNLTCCAQEFLNVPYGKVA